MPLPVDAPAPPAPPAAIASADGALPGPCTLEERQPFAQSLLWQLQRRYYELRGRGAWDSGQVPSYVTSNTFIARSYAQVVLSYLQDCAAGHGPALDPAQPVYIVEAAAGHGRFGFLFLRAFLALLDASTLRGLQIRYLMTDQAEANLKHLAAQPLLRPFVDSGVLDFARFDVEQEASLHLLGSGVELRQTHNPLIVFANYLFDTTAHDLYRVQSGALLTGLVTTTAPHPIPDLSQVEDAELITRLTTRYDYVAPAAPPYDDPAIMDVLEGYRQRLGDTTLPFPRGAFAALRNLRDLSGQRLLLLTSDKGYTHEDELLYLDGPAIQFHGSMSLMVNYHALGRYVSAVGGAALLTSQRGIMLKTAALLFGGGALWETRRSFQQHCEAFGPYDFFRLSVGSRNESPRRSIDHVLSLLRLSGNDPSVVLDAAEELRIAADQATEEQQQALLQALALACDNFYPIGAQDLPFETGRILLAMKRPREAARYNQRSLDLFGEHPVTLLNLGICHHHAELLEEAQRCFTRALKLQPDYPAARSWLVCTEAALEGRR